MALEMPSLKTLKYKGLLEGQFDNLWKAWGFTLFSLSACTMGAYERKNTTCRSLC